MSNESKGTTLASRSKTIRLAQLGMLVAILIILDLTGIGLIRTPLTAFTIMHVPVIIGAITLGPAAGAFLGGTFGVISMLEATFKPSGVSDMAFSPFLSGNPIGSLIMCIGCRILLGLAAGLLFKYISKLDKTNVVAAVVSSAVATLIHTFTVLCSLWLFFPELGLSFKAVLGAIAALNFPIELITAVIFAIAFAKVIPVITKRTSRKSA